MSDVEPQRCKKPVPLVLCREYALRDITSASGFSPRIPACPPVHGQISEQRDRWHPDRIQARKERKPRARLPTRGIKRSDLCPESVHPTYGMHCEDCEHDHHSHFQDELKQVGYE